MKYTHPSRKGFARDVLKGLGGMNRHIIGYAYNPGGYKPWPAISRRYYLLTVERMKNQGWIEESKRNGKKFLKLTKKGRVQALIYKLQDGGNPEPKIWDRKWRIATFDIPEKGRLQRDQIRGLLRLIGFHPLQKSVYVYPYELPADAISYLKISGLDRFIRFMRVDCMDDDDELRKAFKLPKWNTK